MINSKEIKKEEQKRLLEAKKNFQNLQEEIKPFIRQKKIEMKSTAGEWCETSEMSE